MSYTPPAYTDAGGALSSGYTAPAYTDAGGDLAPAPPVVSTGAPAFGLLVTVVQLSIDGSTTYYADMEYGDKDPDTGIGTRWHDPRVTGDIAYSRGGEPELMGASRSAGGLGNIELLNVDGALDTLVTGVLHDASVAVYLVQQDAPMSEATQVAAAVVTAIEARGEQTVRLITGDVRALLDVPLQDSLYASGDGAAALIGRPRPIAIGKPLNCPIVLVDDVDYLYDVHDRDGFEVDIVRDSGAVLALGTDPGDGYKIATDPGIHGIELLQQPIGRVVADIDCTSASAVPVIGAAEGDFDTDLTDWTVTTITSGGGTASATWSAGVALLEADKSAVGSGIAAEARMTFPDTLTAGQRYDYSLAYDVTITGDATLQAQFVPDSGAAGEHVSFGYVLATGAGTISGTFTAPAAGKLRIRAAAASLGEISAEIDTVRLDQVTAGGDVADVIELLLARAGIGVDQVDADSLSALRTARPWAVSYWADGAERIRDVLERVLASVYGWTFTDAQGRIAFAYLQPPETGDSVLDLTEVELAGEIEVEPDHAPGLSTTVAGARNWYRYGPGELADIIDDAERALLTADFRIRCESTDPVGVELRRRSGARVSDQSESGIATLLDEETDIQAAADYLADLYPEGEPRRFYRVPVFLSRDDAATLASGSKITLTCERFGCESGRPLRFLQIDGRVGDDIAWLRCWGSAVEE